MRFTHFLFIMMMMMTQLVTLQHSVFQPFFLEMAHLDCHAVTQGFVQFQMDLNTIFLYLIKKH